MSEEEKSVLEAIIKEKEHEIEDLRFRLNVERETGKTERDARRNMKKLLKGIMHEIAMSTVIKSMHSERNEYARGWVREIKAIIDTDVAIMALDSDDIPF